MLPVSFSATALQVAENCPARYYAESVLKAPAITNDAAGLGSAVHGALERGIKVYMSTGSPPTEKDLHDFFYLEYMMVFGVVDEKSEDFMDGREMLHRWWYRQDWDTLNVISAEVKESFPVPFIFNGEEMTRPFNFIWDRHDNLGNDEYKIVDYKTNRWPISPQDLKKKVQARAYGLAGQIKYPDAKRIWVEFDMLRHSGPVGISFTREDNIATWGYIKKKAQEIAEMDEKNLVERLNPECNFCIRKASCDALQANIFAEGIMGVTTAEEMIDLRARLEYQVKGARKAIDELDTMILAAAKAEDVTEFAAGRSIVRIGVTSRRAVDAEMVELAIGPDLFRKYGGLRITLAAVDKLIKGDELDDQRKSQLRGLIYYNAGEPSVKVETKNPIDEDN